MLYVQKADDIIAFMMIIETLKKYIRKSGKTRYRIAQESGVSESQLCKIFQGLGLRCDTADKLMEYFDLEIRPKKKRGK